MKSNSQKLASFIINYDNKETLFHIYGEYDIESRESDFYINGENFNAITPYPEFYNLKSTQEVNGKEIPFTPEGSNWAGRHFDESDMINEFICDVMLNGSTFKSVYICPKIQQIIDYFTDHRRIALTYKDRKIPQAILWYDMHIPYSLLLVTDKYLYYCYEDIFYMFGVEDHVLIADGYFAEEGFWQSVQHVESGEEKLIWGKLPE